ncbi:hypothetical protein RI049_09600 [Cedecea neteri]|uniref:hypothetical protein n=1 Tax=Cedecea neteri TaxID=158822 RepID=UPI002AA8D36F|nr:hypothetical protein [Cedecea neteri]WPU24967.1 hypothetical protein RI049_09600 [Cedecea neteri]
MDKKEIRRMRLKEWFADKAIPEREKSYISQLINGKASFGERAARRLEREYGMSSNYLDSDPDGDSPPQHAINSQEERLLQLFSRLPESEKKHHLNALEDKVSEYERLFNEMLKIRNINKIDKKS